MRHAGSYFGVEVTEFYYSQSNARLRNIPGYLNEILEESKFRHKNDRKELDVVEFTIKSDRWPDQKAKGIFQELPIVSAYVDQVTKIILDKDRKLSVYSVGLTHINLVIFDTEYRLHSIPVGDFYRNFFTPSFKTAISQSRFREVFYITQMEREKWVCIPLKMLFLLSELFIFNTVLGEYYKDLQVQSNKVLLFLFAEYLDSRTVDKVYTREDEKGVEVIYGNNGVCLTSNDQLDVRDYRDYSIPVDTREVTHNKDQFMTNPDFETHVNEFTTRNTFVSEIGFNIANMKRIMQEMGE
jgi:hypothetical protein